MELGLSEKRFVVTGGTRGIGRAVVDGLLAEGAAVAYCARTPEAVTATQSELTAGGAPRSVPPSTWVTQRHWRIG